MAFACDAERFGRLLDYWIVRESCRKAFNDLHRAQKLGVAPVAFAALNLRKHGGK